MPKIYKPFNVMKNTDALERLRQPAAILYGQIGPPPDHFDMDDQVSWVDLVTAAPVGRLEKQHRKFVELTANVLSKVRRGEANRTSVKLLGECLHDMGLTPVRKSTPAARIAVLHMKKSMD